MAKKKNQFVEGPGLSVKDRNEMEARITKKKATPKKKAK
jgi:hypothetical protein